MMTENINRAAAHGKAAPANLKKHAVLLSVVLLLIFGMAVGLSGCGQGAVSLQDGYYTAQAAEPDRGWTEFLTICVSNDRIVAAEFQARTASGFIKSWDMAYMRTMNAVDGTYPNEYVRTYTSELLAAQNEDIDGLTGATHSYNSFKMLAPAVIEQAKHGDKTVVIVAVPSSEQ